MKTMRNMILIRFGALCLGATALTLGTAGCLVIPTPHRDTGYARTNLTTLTPQEFTPGQSAREDVMLALGEPDAVSADEQKLAYRSEKTVAAWIMFIGGGYSGEAFGGGINQERFYVFEFDLQGRLLKTTRTGKLLGDVDFDTGELLKDANTGETVVSQPLPDEGFSNNVTSCVSGEPIWRIYPNASWLADVNGYQDRRAINAIGERGRLVLTESNLLFFCNARFANDRPALRVPLVSVADARVDKYFPVQRVVVQTQSGQIHSFEIRRTGGYWLDKPAMRAACKFIRSKISPTPSTR